MEKQEWVLEWTEYRVKGNSQIKMLCNFRGYAKAKVNFRSARSHVGFSDIEDGTENYPGFSRKMLLLRRI